MILRGDCICAERYALLATRVYGLRDKASFGFTVFDNSLKWTGFRLGRYRHGSSFRLNTLFYWGYRSIIADIDFRRFVDIAPMQRCFHTKPDTFFSRSKQGSDVSSRLRHAAQTLAAVGQMDTHGGFGGVGVLALDGVINHVVFTVHSLQIHALFFLRQLG